MRLDKHIENTCRSAQCKFGFLKRRLWNATPNVNSAAYKTIVKPALEYAGIVWDTHSQTEISKLERVQRLVARFIFSCFDRKTAHLDRAVQTPFSQRRKIARQKFLCKLYNRNFKIDPDVYLRCPVRVSARTNHPHAIQPYTPSVDAFKFSCRIRTIVEWNRLDANVFTGCHSAAMF